jgi:hypothetical protein
MRVARLYAARPDISARMSWDGLVNLAAPSISAEVRRRLEQQILGGERLGAPEVCRARGRLPCGRPPVRERTTQIAQEENLCAA